MNRKQIAEAAVEARKFLNRVREHENSDATRNGYPSAATGGALRRQSMELTRALARMRRPG